jgi:hypothetical protein
LLFLGWWRSIILQFVVHDIEKVLVIITSHLIFFGAVEIQQGDWWAVEVMGMAGLGARMLINFLFL